MLIDVVDCWELVVVLVGLMLALFLVMFLGIVVLSCSHAETCVFGRFRGLI